MLLLLVFFPPYGIFDCAALSLSFVVFVNELNRLSLLPVFTLGLVRAMLLPVSAGGNLGSSRDISSLFPIPEVQSPLLPV